jgi:hypothetical protein
MLERRTFLIGLASALATPAWSASEMFTGPISRGTLYSALKWRAIRDIVIGQSWTDDMAYPPTKETERNIQWTFYRNDDPFFNVSINWRATVRWVSPDFDGSTPIAEKDILRVEVDPCPNIVSLWMQSDIETSRDPRVRRRLFAECFRWQDGKPILDRITAVNPADRNVLEKQDRASQD